MKVENPERTLGNMVICKNCFIQFELSNDVVFTQISKDCSGHDFLIPVNAEMYKIDSPVYFIRKKDE